MTRFLPRSLFGQVMLALAGALLVAQAISAGLLFRASEQRRELAVLHAAAFQLLAGQRRDESARPDRRVPRRNVVTIRGYAQDRSTPRLPRRIRFSESRGSPLASADVREPRTEEALSAILGAQGVEIDQLVIARHPFLEDPAVRKAGDRYPLLHAAMRDLPHDLLVVGLKQSGQDLWQVARVPVPPRDGALMRSLALQTLVLFFVLTGLLYLILRRITRPLDALAERTRRFAGAGSPEEPLAVSGPEDIRRLIDAHNAMQARIGAMLNEKDVMLGAIGHDLKTPLAALRVRIEGVQDDAARAKMAATIEDITRTLDEILSLARVGRSDAPPELTDLSALAASVVEEFEDMERPVALVEGTRLAAPVHLTWLKRGLRNLVTNSLRYAGTARVAVLRENGMAVLRVEDDGPGIPENRIHEMLEPFTRGEASRNRETGGAGLGLTLARAVAEQHGGVLFLANRSDGGLRADIRIPL